MEEGAKVLEAQSYGGRGPLSRAAEHTLRVRCPRRRERCLTWNVLSVEYVGIYISVEYVGIYNVCMYVCGRCA